MNESGLEDRPVRSQIAVNGTEYHLGDRVRLHPRDNADIFDLALRGRTAAIAAIERDFENRVHLAVTVDDDPGADFGQMGKPGHRFFFKPEEVELLDASSSPLAREASSAAKQGRQSILIAGIGNIFLGDDAFGVEVVRRLVGRMPPDVRVEDFGIRGFDLAYALLDGYDAAILIDAMPRGSEPGTLYVIEPELESPGSASAANPMLDPHTMDPVKVLRLAASMGKIVSKIIIVGCEPSPFDAEDMQMGLSAPVAAAVDEAAKLVESLAAKINGSQP